MSGFDFHSDMASAHPRPSQNRFRHRLPVDGTFSDAASLPPTEERTTSEDSLARDEHNKAAEHHGKGDHAKGKEHADSAKQHSQTANKHSDQAHS